VNYDYAYIDLAYAAAGVCSVVCSVLVLIAAVQIRSRLARIESDQIANSKLATFAKAVSSGTGVVASLLLLLFGTVILLITAGNYAWTLVSYTLGL